MSAQATPNKIRLLVLDDDKTRGMLQRSDIITAFPFLRGYAERASTESKVNSKGKSCQPCKQKKILNVADYSQIRSLLDRLTKPDKEKLCSLMNAEAIRFYYLNEAGRRVRATLP